MSKKKFDISKKELEKYVKDGLSYQKIAQIRGVHIGSVVHALKREGLYVPKGETKRIMFAVRFTPEEFEIIGKLKKKRGCSTDAQTIREVIVEAAIAAKLVPDDYRPPR